MTYKELLEKLKQLSPEQLDTDVTVLISNYDEFFPINNLLIMQDNHNHNDVLDQNHPYLIYYK